MRKFEVVIDSAIKYDVKSVKMPKRATKYSAGYDLYSPIDITIMPGTAEMIWTNLKVKMEKDEYLLICSTSGMGKRDIRLANGVGIIDSDYYSNPTNDGNFGCRLVNFGQNPYEIKAGDKIGQAIFMKYLVVDDEEEITEERVGGFGSTVK